MPALPERIIYHCLINKSYCSFPQGSVCGGRGQRGNRLSQQRAASNHSSHVPMRPYHLGLLCEVPVCFLCQSVLKGGTCFPTREGTVSTLAVKTASVPPIHLGVPHSLWFYSECFRPSPEWVKTFPGTHVVLEKETIISRVNCLHVPHTHIAYR